MPDTTIEISSDLRDFAEPQRAEVHQRFFKTGRGEYGEGDRFLGQVLFRQLVVQVGQSLDHLLAMMFS